MDVYEKLEELQEKALHDDKIRNSLLATKEEKDPIVAFCSKCQEFGYEKKHQWRWRKFSKT